MYRTQAVSPIGGLNLDLMLPRDPERVFAQLATNSLMQYPCRKRGMVVGML
jgi:hypothetical protein